MPRAKQEKAYSTFTAGFITEATPLAYPEGSCRDINNCDIELNGSVRRRLGLDLEKNGTSFYSLFFVDTFLTGSGGPDSLVDPGTTVPQANLAITVHPWKAPGGKAELNFVVFQIGNTLIVRNWDAETVSSPAAIEQHVIGSYVFNFADGSIPGSGFVYNTTKSVCAQTPLQGNAGFGKLWLTSSATVPFYMDYDPETRELSIARNETTEFGANVKLAIRDFNGIDDGFLMEYQPTPGEMTDEHWYNLFNQGWPYNHIVNFLATASRYPANNMQWFQAKQLDGDGIDVGVLLNEPFGNTRAPRGHVVLDALRTNREQALSFGWLTLTPDTNEIAQRGFTTCAFFAGRVWYAGDENRKRPNGIYFSRILREVRDAAVFCQEGDPTSEDYAELLATDGGVIYLPEADHIDKLEPYGAGILVFARNGVWFIYGKDQGFTADSYSVEKVSSTGILAPGSVIRTDTSVAFWAENSIHVVALPERGVVPAVADVGQDKIFTYYGLIAPEARANATACFDSISKKVFWSWLDAPSYSYPTYQSYANRMLVLDTRTGAFSKYDFASDLPNNFANGPAFPLRRMSRPQTEENVFVDGELVTVGGEAVTVGVDEDSTQKFLNSVKVLNLIGEESTITLSEFYSLRFSDYARLPSVDESPYVSDVTTAPEALGDLLRDKQATYLHSFFTRTENGFELVEGQLVPKHPSGCTVRARWDWHNSAAGGRWSDSQRAYRYVKAYAPTSSSDQFDNGEEVRYTRLKIRGKGKSLTLQYVSEVNKDFQLLGYSIPYTADGQD